jgi:hypothetical protein
MTSMVETIGSIITQQPPTGGQFPHARSFVDCEQVLLQAALADPKPTASPLPRGARCDLLGDDTLTAIQEDENEIAQVVIVCEPEGSSLMMGGLHPRGSLFERPVNIEMAKAHHANFRQVYFCLESCAGGRPGVGCGVWTLLFGRCLIDDGV